MTTYQNNGNNNHHNQTNGNNHSHNSNHQDVSKKEEFRRYLEKSGVLDALTKGLVNLYEEPDRPLHAMDYLRKYLGGGTDKNDHNQLLKRENEELRRKVEQLQKQLALATKEK